MFELAGSEFHRGVLQIEVDRPVSKLRRMANSLGPIKARFISLIFLAAALFLSLFQSPAKFFLDSGYASDMQSAWSMQINFAYFLVIVGVLIHVGVGFWRREYMELLFDKSKQQLRFYHQKGFSYSRPVEGVVPFTQIEGIDVKKNSNDSRGFVTLKMPEHLGAYQKISFSLLSEEQMKFYPLNLMRITGITPKGDWVDPDDELVET